MTHEPRPTPPSAWPAVTFTNSSRKLRGSFVLSGRKQQPRTHRLTTNTRSNRNNFDADQIRIRMPTREECPRMLLARPGSFPGGHKCRRADTFPLPGHALRAAVFAIGTKGTNVLCSRRVGSQLVNRTVVVNHVAWTAPMIGLTRKVNFKGNTNCRPTRLCRLGGHAPTGSMETDTPRCTNSNVGCTRFLDLLNFHSINPFCLRSYFSRSTRW